MGTKNIIIFSTLFLVVVGGIGILIPTLENSTEIIKNKKLNIIKTTDIEADFEKGVGGAIIQEPITSFSVILDYPNVSDLYGIQVKLEDVSVQDTLTESILFVGPTKNNTILIILGEDITLPNNSSKLSLDGHIQQIPSNDVIFNTWDITKGTLSKVSNQRLYIQIESIEVIEE